MNLDQRPPPDNQAALQGLPDTAEVDSETVEELAEEGNAFEAGAVEARQFIPINPQGRIQRDKVTGQTEQFHGLLK
jgi:hypothetical protein